jgi:hypothetical protein
MQPGTLSVYGVICNNDKMTSQIIQTTLFKGTSMIKRSSGYILAFTSLMMALSFACNSGTGPDDNDAAILSNVSALDSVYTGYYRMYDPCTLKVSFNYNASKVSTIDISATLDSGKSWIPVSTVTPSGSNTATVVWPLTTTADTGHFNFFGYKEGYLKIVDKKSGTSINSHTFNIIGNAPFALTSPKGGETFSVNDSISLIYSINTNLTAQIKPCIRPNDSTIQWKALESSSSTMSTTYQRGPVRSFVQKFTLVYFNGLLNWTDKWADHPLQIMLKDYGSGGKIKFSGLITINPN